MDVKSDHFGEINENDRLELIFNNDSKDATSSDSSIVESIDDFNTLSFPNSNREENESLQPDENITANDYVGLQPEIAFLNKNSSEYPYFSHSSIKFDGPVTNVLKIPLKRRPFKFPDRSDEIPAKTIISDRFETATNNPTSNPDKSKELGDISKAGAQKGKFKYK